MSSLATGESTNEEGLLPFQGLPPKGIGAKKLGNICPQGKGITSNLNLGAKNQSIRYEKSFQNSLETCGKTRRSNQKQFSVNQPSALQIQKGRVPGEKKSLRHEERNGYHKVENDTHDRSLASDEDILFIVKTKLPDNGMQNCFKTPLGRLDEPVNHHESENKSSRRSSNKKSKESPFEKLNTLKLLYDCGHLNEEEYKERKNQIINDLTGTSSNSQSKATELQPIMKTVVPHSPPDFTKVTKERAEQLVFDVDKLEWHSAETWVKIDLVPFATGELRQAYFLQDLGSMNVTKEDRPRRLLVAKFCIEDANPRTYLSDVEMQAACAHYAKLYNEHNPPLKVEYAKSWLLKLTDRNDLICCVEEYIPGLYVKYSNNNGFVGTETSTTEGRERNTPQAFSHFTFVASDYKLMVVDIQGVHDNYTDPQIHSADGRGFGSGNLGTYGMEMFLQTHRCNEVCRWLGLRSLNKQFKPGGTAAPNYQMPYRVIKKSSSRITEERNTFSRSNTVSEVLGTTEAARMDQPPLKSSKYDGDTNYVRIAKKFLCCCLGS